MHSVLYCLALFLGATIACGNKGYRISPYIIKQTLNTVFVVPCYGPKFRATTYDMPSIILNHLAWQDKCN